MSLFCRSVLVADILALLLFFGRSLQARCVWLSYRKLYAPGVPFAVTVANEQPEALVGMAWYTWLECKTMRHR